MTGFDPNNDWRLVSTAVYRKPVDARIYGSVELDVTELEAWVMARRAEGLKISIMLPLILLTARAMASEVPELNCYVRRGRLVHRSSVDVLISVLMKDGAGMNSLKVPGADRMAIGQLAGWMIEHLPSRRSNAREDGDSHKPSIARIGWPWRDLIVWLGRKITVDWGLRVPFTKMGPDTFGSFIFTNLGSIGLDVGYPALLPISNVSMVMAMGRVTSKPVVRDDQVVIRRILTLSATLDHRVVDAVAAGKLFRYLRQGVRTPDILL